ncbi:MAG: PEGA domain-containing protein [Planctomycetota bacterium]|nr:PEGA domain-containing protein [Planctomycetota bacterium]
MQPLGPHHSVALVAVVGSITTLFCGGCVERTLRVTSDPQGATVLLNHREVGTTPCEVEFVHYGTFDVEIRLDGYDAWVGPRAVDAPMWDVPGPDLLAQLLPTRIESKDAWHFVLVQTVKDEQGVRMRASELRARVEALCPPPTAEGAVEPAVLAP